MSGSSLPYWLRHNKMADRKLFLEVLLRCSGLVRFQECAYLGMGGAASVDHSDMHRKLGISKLVSIEDPAVGVQRHIFNSPNRLIVFEEATIHDFVANFDYFCEKWEVVESQKVIWLDYTKPSEIGAQLREFSEIIDRCDDGDIIRITLNANPSSLVPADGQEAEVIRSQRLAKLEERLDEFFPATTSADQMTEAKYPEVLQRAIMIAAKKSLAGNKYEFAHLLSTAYADGQQMVTVCGMVAAKRTRKDLNELIHSDDFLQFSADPGKLLKINLPALTPKEKAHIDQQMPAISINDLMNFVSLNIGSITGKQSQDRKQLESYSQLYRHVNLMAVVDG
jgi:hypothetical protein